MVVHNDDALKCAQQRFRVSDNVTQELSAQRRGNQAPGALRARADYAWCAGAGREGMRRASARCAAVRVGRDVGARGAAGRTGGAAAEIGGSGSEDGAAIHGWLEREFEKLVDLGLSILIHDTSERICSGVE